MVRIYIDEKNGNNCSNYVGHMLSGTTYDITINEDHVIWDDL